MERNSCDKGKNIMKEENEREPICDDVSGKILTMLPLKDVARFCCVKKSWAEMIRSEYYTQRFLSQSMSKPRILFTSYISTEPEDGSSYLWFRSIRQEKKPELLGKDHLDHPRLMWDPNVSISQTVLGLVCCHNDQGRSMIYNPSGGGMFRELPKVNISKLDKVNFFLGFDQERKHFKVLCLITGLTRMESHVLTLLDGNNTWKKLDTKTPHIHVEGRLYLDSKVYYGALCWTDLDHFFVMCFDLQKEELNVIKVPMKAKYHRLVKINNKLAIVSNYTQNIPRDIWIYEAETWSKLPYEIPSFSVVSEQLLYDCIGTIGTDQLIFTPRHVIPNDFHVIYYDARAGGQPPRKISIDKVLPTFISRFEVFLDYIENPKLSSIETPM